MGETESLRRVIQDRHDVWCTFIRQESVREATWSGKVHIFSCTDDPAMLVYAWTEREGGAERVVTIPAKDGIRSARDAVRAHLGGMVGGA